MPKRDENTSGFWRRAFKRFQQVFDESSDSTQTKGRRRLAPLQELEDRCLLSATPVGAEFRVNTHTLGAQQTFPQTPQAVAKNVGTGDYVIVWSSQGQNGGGSWDVYMQRYNAAGVAQGGETLVNTHVNGVNQQYASVAMNASGNFVVTWSSDQGGYWNVLAQRYNASGVALGSAIHVDTPTGDDQEFSTAGMDNQGNFAITWSGDQLGNWNTYVNEFNKNGNSQGGPFLVSNPTNADQWLSNLAMNGNGNFVITWSGDQSGNWDVYAQRYGANGQPVGSIFQVNSPSKSDSDFATAAMDANGNFIITWSGTGNGNWDIYARTYQANGAAVSSIFQVNPSSNQDQVFSSVTYGAPDNPIITWSSQNAGPSGWDVYAQQVIASGTFLGSEIRVNTYTQDNQFYSSIAGDQNGNLVAAWTSQNQDGDNFGVYAQRLSASVSSAGIIVTPTSALQTTEAGGTATFSVRLQSAPTAPVTIALGNSNPGQGSLSTSSLTFTAANWNVAQSVTITALDDHIVNGDQTYQVTGTATSTDANYNGRAMTPVTVVNKEADVAGINVTGSTFLVAEDNRVVRINASTGAIVATYSTGVANDGATVGPDGSLYVADYVNNQILHYDATGTFMASFGSGQLSSPQGLAFGPDGNLYVTNVNNTVQKYSPTGSFLGTFIGSGNGLSNAKAIVWGPDGNAYVSSYFNSEVIRYKGTTGAFMNVFATGTGGFEDITFGPDNNLYAASYGDNAVYRYNGTTGASMGTFASGPQFANPYGLRFDSAGNLDVSNRTSGKIQTFDNTGTFLHTLTSGLPNPAYMTTTTSLVTSETGTTATFQVVLASQPTATVTISLTPSVPGQGSLSQSSLTFNAGNWNVAQTVTVTGLNDFIVNGDQTYQINGTAASTDANYNGRAMTPVTVVNKEADVAGFTVTPTSLTTSEGGASASFSVALTSKPNAPVAVNLATSVAGQGSLSTSSLIFTAADWNVAQNVTVTPKDDHIVNGDQTYQVTGMATSTDINYNGRAMTPVTVVNKEADVAGFTVTPTSLTTSETGTSASFSVALTSKPIAPVTINMSSTNPGQGSLSQSSLTFNAGNWNVAQSVTVTAFDDHIVNGDQTYQITGTATSTDANYNGRAMTPVTIVNKEADVAGFTVTPTSLTTSESGTSASFSVALTSKPIAPVTINLSSTNPGQGSLSQSSLTFNAGNWNVAQTVTVTGLNDFIVNGNQTYQINGTAASIDANYNGKSMTPVTVVNKEINSADFVVTPTSLTTSESGTSATFSVALNSIPLLPVPVTLNLSLSMPGQGTLSQTSLTFSLLNWNIPQTVTVTGLSDQIVNGNQSYQINGVGSSLDPFYNGLAMDPVTVVNQEADTAGITVSTSSLTTSETGTAAAFSIALTSKPIAPVTINLATSVPGQGSLSASSLTFDATNWNVLQTVTVSGLDDQIVNGNQTYRITGTATSLDAVYNGLTMAPVTVVNQEADTAGIIVSPASLTTSETGTSTSFSVALRSKPTAPVTINLATSVPDQGSLSLSSLTFDATNWNVAQSVTVTALDDQIVNGNQTYHITGTATSADAVYDDMAMTPVTVVNQEADTAGFTVSPASLTTSETGTTAGFTVALTSKPMAPVTLNLATSTPGQGALSTTSLTFDANNWDVAQSVTVTALDDHIVNGDQTYQITGTATSIDAVYNTRAMTPVTVVNREADVAAIKVTSNSLITSEAGASASFGVSLTSKPLAPATVNLTSTNSNEGLLSQSVLTFDASNWNVPQTITVTGIPGETGPGDNDVTYQIQGSAISADGNYNGAVMPAVTVVNKEIDTSGITVAHKFLTTTEAGAADRFHVVLADRPTATVTINLTSGNPGQGLLSQSSLTFTPSNWNVVQTVTVTGQDDHIVNGNVTYTITGAAGSADGDYNGMAMPDVTVVNKERDVAAINVTPITGLAINAGSGTASFNISLTSKPSANVTIPVASSNPLEGGVSQSVVTFTPADWNAPQTVTVNAKSVPAGSGDVTVNVSLGSALSADANYAGKVANVSVTVLAPEQVPPTFTTTGLGLLAAPPTTNAPPATVSNLINNVPDNSISTANSPVSGRSQPLTVLAASAHANDPLLTLATNAPVQLILGTPNRAIQVFAPIPRVSWQESASVQVVTVMPAERDSGFETIPSHAPTMQAAQLHIRVAPTDIVLDVLNDAGERIPWNEGTEESTTLFTTGLVATTGYVLLNTRIGVWMLSLLTSQPLWRQFDPLEVLYAWEGESEQAEHETEDEETLVSLVD
jgi:hypothetical protein